MRPSLRFRMELLDTSQSITQVPGYKGTNSMSHKWRQTRRSLKIHRQQAYSIYSSISWKMFLVTTQRANLKRCLGHPVRHSRFDWWQGPVQLLNTVPEGEESWEGMEDWTGKGQGLGKYEGQPSLEKAVFQAAMLLTQCCQNRVTSNSSTPDLTWSRTGITMWHSLLMKNSERNNSTGVKCFMQLSTKIYFHLSGTG